MTYVLPPLAKIAAQVRRISQRIRCFEPNLQMQEFWTGLTQQTRARRQMRPVTSQYSPARGLKRSVPSGPGDQFGQAQRRRCVPGGRAGCRSRWTAPHEVQVRGKCEEGCWTF